MSYPTPNLDIRKAIKIRPEMVLCLGKETLCLGQGAVRREFFASVFLNAHCT